MFFKSKHDLSLPVKKKKDTRQELKRRNTNKKKEENHGIGWHNRPRGKFQLEDMFGSL